MLRRRWIIAAALLAGCASPRPPDTLAPQLALPSNQSLIAPDGTEPQPQDPPADLAIETGDVLEIGVFREPDLGLTVRVPPSGTVLMPLAGEIRARGRSPEDLRTEITRKLAEKYLRNPVVNVQIKQFARRRVYVLGEVKNPRDYEIPEAGTLTAMQLLGLAGGLQQGATRDDVRLVRAGQAYRVRLDRIESGERADLRLAPGDVLVVRQGAKTVYVLGAVKNPSGYALPSGDKLTAARAISMAGGFAKYASPADVQVLRQSADGDQVRLRINVEAVLAGNLRADCELQAGDIVFVPEGGW